MSEAINIEPPHPAALRELLDGQPTADSVRRLLEPVGFGDIPAAHERLTRMAGDSASRSLLAECLPTLLLTLSDTADPDQALLNFERFVHSVPQRAELFEYLKCNPRAIEILIRLFVGSQFLTEILLCNPAYLERLTQHKRLADLKSVQQLFSEARAAMIGLRELDEKYNALRRFQRWELLRIGICDFFGLLDLRRVTVQLSLLADSLVQACLDLAYADSEASRAGFVVVALGKLGGEELNYSSDIDLLFLCDSNAANHWRIGQRLIKGLTVVSGDGFLYRVDMRLRPWGRSGPLVTSVDSHVGYLHQNAQLWEKQALLKARVIAGDAQLGAEFLRRAEPLLFNTPQETVRESVRGMKQKIEAELKKKGRIWGEVKLGQGSIRDVEFVAQYLQLVHGGAHREVRSFNTLDALVRLTDCGFLQADDYRVLTDGYVFLRTVEHALQLVHNKQTHELPADPAELTYLARRLDFGTDLQLLEQYQRHCRAIRAIYDRYLGVQNRAAAPGTQHAAPAVRQHLSRMERSYSETFSDPDIERHARLAEQIDDRNPVIVEAAPLEDETWRVTIVGYDYLGELSVICGLLLVYGGNILSGEVFTYEPLSTTSAPPTAEQRMAWRKRHYQRTRNPPAAAGQHDHRQKIVDVFTVRGAPGAELNADTWGRYAQDLSDLLRQLQAGSPGEAHGALAKRVAAALRKSAVDATHALYPVDIEIDNAASEQYTVLRIRTRDTLGFLYELTNSLALHGVYIARVRVAAASTEALDTLYVTDAHGQKITDPAKQRELQAATVLIKHFTHLLPHSPNPEAALLHFREFVAQLFTRPDWPAEIASLERTEVLDALARLLGVSDFLWNDFLRMQHANLFPVVRNVAALANAKTRAALQADATACLAAAKDPESRRTELNAFKDREMFRADMRHILGYAAEFEEFSSELTDVAEVVVEAAYEMCNAELQAAFGAPRLDDGRPCAFSLCALGKCGGRELGFASDIELMCLYEDEGKTTGPQRVATSEFFVKLVECLTHAIRARREGIFEIDLRLRPYGRAGSVAVSLNAFQAYFGPEGAAWPFERQALVKLRPIAGDAALGRRIVDLRDQLIYTGEPFDVAAMGGMRQRQIRQLVTPGTFNVKLSPGGLVDTEYLVQGLQITHAKRDPRLRATNTLDALTALTSAGIVSPDQCQRLREAYIFQRAVIGALRIVRGNAKDLTIPPEGSEEFAFLARRLNYENDLERLHQDLGRHAANVLELSQKLLA